MKNFILSTKFLIVICVLIILLFMNYFINLNKDDNSIFFGDNVALLSGSNDSLLLVYDEEFDNIKLQYKLKGMYTDVDQISSKRIKVYNKDTNRSRIVELDFTDSKLKAENEITDDFHGDESIQIIDGSLGDPHKDNQMLLLKKDSYKLINNPQLIINDNTYFLSDYTQLTSYMY